MNPSTKNRGSLQGEKRSERRRWIIAGLVILGLAVLVGGVFAWRTGSLLNRITGGKADIFGSLIKSLPGNEQKLIGEDRGRVNILLLGMRGENDPAGGTLADTIMVLSIHPKQGDKDASKASLISIPRDLYVTDPGTENRSKVNAVYAYGEQRQHGVGGIADMRQTIGDITGLDIPYAVTLNFQGFIDLVNAVGGVTVNLSQPFDESQQFHEPQVCDADVYTIPTKPAQYEYKYRTHSNGVKTVVKAYPLCYNHDEECGGDFKLPVGANHLDGKTALCYARSRYTSSDFERAKRQQEVIQQIKAKALSVGTLADFSKVNAILDSLGKNVTTNLQAWEMKRFFDLYHKLGDVTVNQAVIDNSDGGLLYAPPETKETGYILLPKGDNYDGIRALFKNSLN